jgi:hypothetical protein
VYVTNVIETKRNFMRLDQSKHFTMEIYRK